MENKYKGIGELLMTSRGIDISGFDSSFVEKSIGRRCSACNDLTNAEYLELLKANELEADLLIDSLHVSYTEFFRNPLTFSCLEQVVLPLMLAAKVKRKEKSIRIWSAACASGPEPYSLAMLIDELNCNHPGKINFQIFATDNNLPELSKAGMGIFPAISMTKVTLKRAQSYFTRDGEQYTISPHLKGMVDFSYFDLLSDSRSCPEPSIYGNFDLVMCSNLLFYYQPELRLKILGKVEATMTPGAFLVTGETERDLLLKNGYQEVIEYSAIFRKRY